MKQMRRVQAIILLLAAFAAGRAFAETKFIAASGAGKLENIDGVRVVTLAGTPHEIGVQHGTLLKTEIKDLVNYFFVEKKNLFGTSKETISQGAKILEKHIPAEYIEEMKGIAEGAGVEYDRILFTNTFLDVVSANWVGARPSCSNFAAFPGMSKNGDVVHGRNLEWSPDQKISDMNTVFFITPKDGATLVMLSWPGMTGTLTGMNANGISMGEMTSMSSDATLEATPIMIQLRMLLERSKTLEEAWSVLADVPRTTGYNVLVTDGKSNSGFVAEMNAKHIIRYNPEGGFLMHTNHYVDKNMYKAQKKYLYLFSGGAKADTFLRYDRYLDLLKQYQGAIDVQTAITILSDKYDPLLKAVSGQSNNSISSTHTLQSAVMLPKTGDIYVALRALPAPDGGYVHLQLPMKDK